MSRKRSATRALCGEASSSTSVSPDVTDASEQHDDASVSNKARSFDMIRQGGSFVICAPFTPCTFCVSPDGKVDGYASAVKDKNHDYQGTQGIQGTQGTQGTHGPSAGDLESYMYGDLLYASGNVSGECANGTYIVVYGHNDDGKDVLSTVKCSSASGNVWIPKSITQHIENPVEFYSHVLRSSFSKRTRLYGVVGIHLCPVRHVKHTTRAAGGRLLHINKRFVYWTAEDDSYTVSIPDSLDRPPHIGCVELNCDTPGEYLGDDSTSIATDPITERMRVYNRHISDVRVHAVLSNAQLVAHLIGRGTQLGVRVMPSHVYDEGVKRVENVWLENVRITLCDHDTSNDDRKCTLPRVKHVVADACRKVENADGNVRVEMTFSPEYIDGLEYGPFAHVRVWLGKITHSSTSDERVQKLYGDDISTHGPYAKNRIAWTLDIEHLVTEGEGRRAMVDALAVIPSIDDILGPPRIPLGCI